jgi:3-oxoacyl-[acyl-carrier protein] reductase
MNAIVTGATKGIGKAIAIKLARSGYDLELASLEEELADSGVRIFSMAVDCSRKDQLYDFCEQTKAMFGYVDVLVNNAGSFIPGLLLDEDDSIFENQLELNLNAAYYLSKYFGKIMRSRGKGHIFNICSVASKEIVENAGSYSVTKSALLSLNNVLRQELSKYNVNVTAILPGSTLTPSWEGTTIPAERFVQPEDIASSLYTILSLSSGVNVDEITIKPLNFNA